MIKMTGNLEKQYQQFERFEVYEATMELRQAVERMMDSGYDLLTATNEQGAAYVHLLSDAEKNLKKAIENINQVEAIRSSNDDTKQVIQQYAEVVEKSASEIQAIQQVLTEKQNEKFEQVFNKVIEKIDIVEMNINESVERAINKSIQKIDKKYETALTQHIEENKQRLIRYNNELSASLNDSFDSHAQNLSDLNNVIDRSVYPMEKIVKSLRTNLILIAVGSGVAIAILTSVIIKWFFIR